MVAGIEMQLSRGSSWITFVICGGCSCEVEVDDVGNHPTYADLSC